MEPELGQLSFSGILLKRGFWLYVWEITLGDNEVVYYVGRTGDNASPKAQSPFARVCAHLGANKHSNALRRNLRNVQIVPERCLKFDLIAYGPIYDETDDRREHEMRRNHVGAFEKALRDSLCRAGYKVLNSVNCHWDLDQKAWNNVCAAFSTHFPKLHVEIRCTG